jgi:hypothetical protein
MATLSQKVREDDIVKLRKQVGPWPAGREGMVVAENGSLKLVEIADEQGATIDFISVPEDQRRVAWRAPQDI